MKRQPRIPSQLACIGKTVMKGRDHSEKKRK
jgi:hypothetical protein